MRLVLIGLVLGALGSVAAGQLYASLMYGVSRIDAIAFLGAALLLLMAATAALLVPARRATRVDPLSALRAM
jgi:ABC-type antimicrobial peptide transport system permease subunit